MITLKIDNIEIQAREGSSVLEAARQAGIRIPSMCHLNGYGNHPSCMVCIVKDNVSGNLIPSCSLKAAGGMDIIASDAEVLAARKQALELMMSDHVGDCEAPCSLACPAGMNIPLMNRLIAEGRFTEALQIVKEDISLPYILGYVCPAPCEKACRRKQIDNPVSICLLKRFSAAAGEDLKARDVSKTITSGKKVAIIGAGPAGLSAAYYLLILGHSCDVFDKYSEPGGTLRYSIPEEELPREVINRELDIIRSMGAVFHCNSLITEEVFNEKIRKQYDAVIMATGDILTENHLAGVIPVTKSGYLVNEKNLSAPITGVFVCGSAIRPHKMAVRSAAQGKTAALAIHEFLQGKQYEKPAKIFNSRFDRLAESEFEEYLKECSKSDRISPIAPGNIGFSPDEAIREAFRCMHCDCRKQDNCKLREYAHDYQVERKKYLVGERRFMTKQMQHNRVVFEREKCIKCGLCIEISSKEKEKYGLAFEGRGFDVYVNVPLGLSFSESLTHSAMKCASACPTGALSIRESKNQSQ